MRNVLLVLLLGASACAARTSTSTLHARYTCGDVAVSRDGSEIHTGTAGVLGRLSWHDDAGDHFVVWPSAPTDRDAMELIVPSDPHLDAVQRTYDTTFGSSTVDWRLIDKQVCTASGGYNDVLARYMKGESIDDLTTSIGATNRDETRTLIRKALVSLQHRYWRDR